MFENFRDKFKQMRKNTYEEVMLHIRRSVRRGSGINYVEGKGNFEQEKGPDSGPSVVCTNSLLDIGSSHCKISKKMLFLFSIEGIK